MMRKSPGKWIKTLLLGKKSFKSRSSKGRASVENAEGPVISEPLSISTGRIEAKPQLENEVKYDVACGGHESIPDEKDPDLTAAVIEDSNYSERSSKEQAAMRAQSAFRGYLARRAFRALKGIIRLQAVIRGHLVRRQAVATLKCTWGIVRFQMLARSKKFSQTSDLQDASHVRSFRRIRSSLQGKDSVNAFIRKILSFSIIAKPLKIQYHRRDPNEALTWLERWTSSKFWKSPTLQKNYVDPTSKETPRSRPKFSVRRNFGIKKIPSPTVQENSESELEKVKRSLRKVSSASGQLQTCLIEKVNDVIIQDSTNRKVNSDSHELSGSTDQEQVKGGSAEDNTNDYNRTLTSDEKPSVDRQRGRKINAEVEDYTGSIDQEQVKGRSVEDNSNGNNGTLTSEEKPSVDHRRGSKVNVEAEDYFGYTDQQQVKNGGVKSPPGEEEEEEEEEEDNNGDNGALTFEEKDSVDHRRGSKRRASFPAKSEQVENGVQNTPVLPSYMAATQSAKAKFFGHGVEKAAFIRRHSLPSAKPASISPRTQKVCQPSCKAIVKEKPVPVAWKR